MKTVLTTVFNFVQSTISMAAGAVLVTLVGVAIFAPSPNGPPTASTVEWSEEMTAADKVVASTMIATAQWEIADLKVISFAHGQVPITGTKIAMVGINGRWAVAEVE